MTLFRVAEGARAVLVVTAFALFADLFLEWRDVSVRTSGVAVDAGTSAWSGWGALAGVLLIAFLVLELARRRPVTAGVLALLASAFTIVEFFTGEADVDVTGVVSVSTDERLWPAYLGVALAVVLASGAAIRLAAHIQAPTVERLHGAA
jgi:hypothetical protein